MQKNQEFKITGKCKDAEDQQNAPLIRCSTLKEKSPKTILPMQSSGVLVTRSDAFLTGQDGGLVKMDVKPVPGGGFKPGSHGSVKTLTGSWQRVAISRDPNGIALLPPLTVRDWRLIDDEIDRERYDNPRWIRLHDNDRDYWQSVLVQGQAALLPAPFEHILTRLTRLKLQKPTQTMNEQAVSVFLEDICEHLERRDYAYFAIDQGIINLIEQEDDKFFPTMKVLIKYIHPIHWKLKKRISKIEELLKQSIKKEH